MDEGERVSAALEVLTLYFCVSIAFKGLKLIQYEEIMSILLRTKRMYYRSGFVLVD